jgi:hypothetical protein
MAFDIQLKHILTGLALIILAFFLSVVGIFGYIVIKDRQAANYPGAVQLSMHDQVSVYPQVSYKQATSYRSMDDFVSIYNWYSTGFSLGPEKQAQSKCIHMYDTSKKLGVSRIIAVTVCDTPNGRMIFVQRTVEVEGK